MYDEGKPISDAADSIARAWIISFDTSYYSRSLRNTFEHYNTSFRTARAKLAKILLPECMNIIYILAYICIVLPGRL